LVRLAVLSFVLPLLLGLMPNPGTSAASALERDIALSICGSYGNGGPAGPQQHPAHPDACVLCSICAAAAGSAPVDAGAALIALNRSSVVESLPRATQLRPASSWLLFGSPPRGPPSILLV
jgi:hypothetical protein